MDRRRTGFLPSWEGLEGRRLLSATAQAVPGTPSPPNLPPGVTLASNQQKLDRIERLPYFLRTLDPNRPLPDSLTRPIQADLLKLKGRLHQPPRPLLTTFNEDLRGLISQGSVRGTDAARLNRTFGEILLRAGGDPQAVAGLQASLNQLTQLAVTVGEKPTSLVANDYATILQTALAVGRPLRAPGVPRLSPSDDSEPRGDMTTTVRRPHLIGAYDPGTVVTVYDAAGQALGSAPVSPSGQYTIAIDRDLPEGRNVLFVQARDLEGALSLPSRNFVVKILPATPRGPMALGR